MTNIPVTVANGTSLSASVDLRFAAVAGIYMSAAWTSAFLTFQASSDGLTFSDIFNNDGTEYKLTVAAGQFVPFVPLELPGVRFLKIRSGVTGTAVNQGADRLLTLVTREVLER